VNITLSWDFDMGEQKGYYQSSQFKGR
jgi:hypothetical protein